jgi:hypothetical protein
MRPATYEITALIAIFEIFESYGFALVVAPSWSRAIRVIPEL